MALSPRPPGINDAGDEVAMCSPLPQAPHVDGHPPFLPLALGPEGVALCPGSQMAKGSRGSGWPVPHLYDPHVQARLRGKLLPHVPGGLGGVLVGVL